MISRLILLTCIFAIWSTVVSAMSIEQLKTVAMGFRKTCQSKVNVDTAILDGMSKGEFPEDPDFQCYLMCLMKTSRAIRNDKLDMDMMIKQVDIMLPKDLTERAKSAMRKCEAEATSGNACVLAYQFLKCYRETDKDVYFFV